MAETKPQPEAAPPAAESAPAAAPPAAPEKKGFKLGTIGMVAAIMLLEGVGLFFAMKMFGSSPDPVAAVEHAAASRPALEDEEIPVVQLRALNNKSGRPMLYSIKVVIRVKSDVAEVMKKQIEKKKATVEDAVARIIRSAEPAHLAEDGLETLRRQIQYELGRITNEESSIDEILIPECTPFPTGF